MESYIKCNAQEEVKKNYIYKNYRGDISASIFLMFCYVMKNVIVYDTNSEHYWTCAHIKDPHVSNV